TINQVDQNGNTCPLKDKSDVECPAICVRSLSNCPTSLAPSCPDDQVFCADGQCHDRCTDETQANNPCHCQRSGKHLPSQTVDLVPCAAISNVTIHQYKSWIKDQQTFQACAAEANIGEPASIGIWKDKDWDKPLIWAQCPDPPQAMYEFNESMWKGIFSIIAIVGFLIISWTLFKLFIERNVRAYYRNARIGGKHDELVNKTTDNEKLDIYTSNTHSPSSSTTSVGSAPKGTYADDEKQKLPGCDKNKNKNSNQFDSDNIQLRGYRSNLFGTFIGYIIFLTSLFWVCFMSVLTADFYGKLPGAHHGK
ncbi:hypothetical protein EV182_007243, partial [Spiromyces aspiralis]